MKNEENKPDQKGSGGVSINDVLRNEEFKDLTYDEAVVVVESLQLFCHILAEMYFMTGKFNN
jgi:hypothetical protein